VAGADNEPLLLIFMRHHNRFWHQATFQAIRCMAAFGAKATLGRISEPTPSLAAALVPGVFSRYPNRSEHNRFFFNRPTIAEAGVPGYSFLGWLSLFAPAGTPDAIIAPLNAYLDQVIKSSDLQSAFARQSIQPGGGLPKIAGALLQADIALWPPIIKSAPLH
jgi:tripartite-type tricarboxylate transporter receptor subunit TctC